MNAFVFFIKTGNIKLKTFLYLCRFKIYEKNCKNRDKKQKSDFQL